MSSASPGFPSFERAVKLAMAEGGPEILIVRVER